MVNNKVYGLLGLATKAGKIAFGTENCIDLIERKKLKLVILAEDSSQRTIDNFKRICKENNIDIYIYGTKEEISKAIGKVNKTIVGVRDFHFSEAIKKTLNGGDVIG